MNLKTRRARRRRRSFMPVLIVLGFIVIVLGIVFAGIVIKKYTPSNERVSLSDYFMIDDDSTIGLLVQDQVIADGARLIDGEIYITYSVVTEYLNSRFYLDTNENKLLYALPEELVKVSVGSESYSIGRSKESLDYQIVKVEGDVSYIALDFIKKYTDLDVTYFEEDNHLMIVDNWDDVVEANVKKDTEIRVLGGIKSDIIQDVDKGETVTILVEGDNWSFVRTENGCVGYIQNKRLKSLEEVAVEREFEEPVYTNIEKDYTINMVWHQVTNQTANNNLADQIANAKGITTISPTWFRVQDEEGNISSLASYDYVEYCHQNDIEVWALVSNFEEDIDISQVLNYTSNRQRMVNQLIAQAIEYDIDGINVDFEQLEESDAAGYLEFIRELSIKCRNNGLVLSIDNYVPTSYTAFYDREEQGKVADYVIIMGYDENYEGSETAGSVASINFVEMGIADTLAEVPAGKVILGIPFYTRIWKETLTGDSQDSTAYTTTSETAGMDAVTAFLNQYSLEPTWDEETGENYAEVTEGSVTYKVWIEDSTSISEKLKLMKSYELAGVSAWKLGLENDSIWDTIIKYVN